jgi:hypothetical protein
LYLAEVENFFLTSVKSFFFIAILFFYIKSEKKG